MSRIPVLTLLLAVLPVRTAAITWPVASRGVGGTFGELRISGSGSPRYHLGTDVVSCGEPVHASIATGGGIVTNVAAFGNNSDLRVVIDGFYQYDHLAGDATFYSLLSEYQLAQARGELLIISEGQIIGTSGSTGGVPCHLHFQAGADHVSADFFNPLAYFSDGDTVNGVLAAVSMRQSGNVVVPDVQDGSDYPQTGAVDFVVRGNDCSNALPTSGGLGDCVGLGRNVNWARITFTLDGSALQDFQFLQLSGMPNVADVYSMASPASSFSPPSYWYQMGSASLADGQHQICITGYDLNQTTSRASASTCRTFYSGSSSHVENPDGDPNTGDVPPGACVTFVGDDPLNGILSYELDENGVLFSSGSYSEPVSELNLPFCPPDPGNYQLTWRDPSGAVVGLPQGITVDSGQPSLRIYSGKQVFNGSAVTEAILQNTNMFIRAIGVGGCSTQFCSSLQQLAGGTCVACPFGGLGEQTPDWQIGPVGPSSMGFSVSLGLTGTQAPPYTLDVPLINSAPGMANDVEADVSMTSNAIPYAGKVVVPRLIATPTCSGQNCVVAKPPNLSIQCGTPNSSDASAIDSQGLVPACNNECTFGPAHAIYPQPIQYTA